MVDQVLPVDSEAWTVAFEPSKKERVAFQRIIRLTPEQTRWTPHEVRCALKVHLVDEREDGTRVKRGVVWQWYGPPTGVKRLESGELRVEVEWDRVAKRPLPALRVVPGTVVPSGAYEGSWVQVRGDGLEPIEGGEPLLARVGGVTIRVAVPNQGDRDLQRFRDWVLSTTGHRSNVDRDARPSPGASGHVWLSFSPTGGGTAGGRRYFANILDGLENRPSCGVTYEVASSSRTLLGWYRYDGGFSSHSIDMVDFVALEAKGGRFGDLARGLFVHELWEGYKGNIALCEGHRLPFASAHGMAIEAENDYHRLSGLPIQRDPASDLELDGGRFRRSGYRRV